MGPGGSFLLLSGAVELLSLGATDERRQAFHEEGESSRKMGCFRVTLKALSGWYVLRFISFGKRSGTVKTLTRLHMFLLESVGINRSLHDDHCFPHKRGLSPAEDEAGCPLICLASSSPTVSATLTPLPILTADIKIYFHSGAFSARFEVAASVVEH